MQCTSNDYARRRRGGRPFGRPPHCL